MCFVRRYILEMKIKQLARHEMNDLEMTTNVFSQEVEAALSKVRDEKVRLYLPKNEKYRLLKLHVWMEKYSVDLLYILQNLVPFWEQFVRRRSKALKSEGLGVRVSTLTGKKSEQVLQDIIARDFPSDQNVMFRRLSEQNRILSMERVASDGIKTSSDDIKNLFDFQHPKGFLTYYRRRIRRQSALRDHITQEMKKYPFRNNPFK